MKSMIQSKYFNVAALFLTDIALLITLFFVPHTTVFVSTAQGQTCSFVQANCSWDPVDGATSYNVTVTDTNSNTVIKQDTIQSPITTDVFPITQGDTYRCDVAAVNSCGAAGTAGSASALCAENGLVASASPTLAPTTTLAACGGSCQTTADCQEGYTCITANNGTGICGLASLQSQCALNPDANTCCVVPTTTPAPPPPTLPPTGTMQNTFAAAAGVVATIFMGVFLIWRSTL